MEITIDPEIMKGIQSVLTTPIDPKNPEVTWGVLVVVIIVIIVLSRILGERK